MGIFVRGTSENISSKGTLQIDLFAARIVMMLCPVTEMKHYCSALLPYASDQPVKTEQLPAAVFEANALYCARAHSTEIEWSRQAAAAQRSRQVDCCW